uniref:NADH-ubiquinone oxidoreductase chain 5 n=1 Tax=Podagrion sp. JY-2018 TaxID=2109700 RepID=A0A2R4FZQ3_9HYME|nr:NADH dehydrogenase subunit 5 [Podagrion sp. JY-2018]
MLLFYLSGIYFFIISMLFFLFSLMFMYLKVIIFLEWNVFSFYSVNINMLLYFDWMTFMFMFTVLFISSMIMIYCTEYMSHDNYINRFYYLVYLFIMSMLIMIMSPNMISILIGWDGLGLISYCLVIYYQNYSSFNSGMLTIFLNRIGDVMIIMSISLMFIYGSWNYVNLNHSGIIMLMLVVIASFTKSAQFPFSSWLPMAMAAPTPVSSLVHSSTLVTAGIYLLIRFNYLIYKYDNLLMIIMVIGLLTMLMAGMSANFEYDFKKIIAYSTLSQLGLMMMIYSFKMYELTFFHLIIHAMFKSMMFMCSGVMIHYTQGCQDIRFYSNMKELMPMTSSVMMIGNFSLCGLPFMSGFYSKDQILESMFMGGMNLMIYLFLLLSTGLTVSYSCRLMYYLMSYKMNFYCYMYIKDDFNMNLSMILLMFNSIFIGMGLNWLMFMNIEYIYLNFMEKISILLICLVGVFLGKFNYSSMYFNKFYYFKFFFGKMWFLYSFNLMIIYYLNLGKFWMKIFDKGWSEFYFKNSVNMMLVKIKILDSNLMNNYFMIMMLSMGMMLLLLIFM